MGPRDRQRGGGGKALQRVGGMDAFNYQMLSLLKTKEERLGLMERMSRINDNVGTYIAPEPEVQIGGYTGVEGEWATRTAKVQDEREKNPRWVRRFAGRIDALQVVETDPKVIKQKKQREAALADSRNRIMSLSVSAPPAPAEPVFASFGDMLPASETGQRAGNHYCVKCWLAAGAGPRRKDCQFCANFLCSRCVQVEKIAAIAEAERVERQKRMERARAEERGRLAQAQAQALADLEAHEHDVKSIDQAVDLLQLASRSGSDSPQGTPEKEEEEEEEEERRGGCEWVCPYCQDELSVTNHAKAWKYESGMYNRRCAVAVIKMQAAVRKSKMSRWFRKAVLAAKLMQRAIRARIYWKRMELLKKLEKRPVRIRIHDIDIFLRREEQGPAPVKLPVESFKLGDTPAGAYEEIFGLQAEGKAQVNDGSLEEAMFNLLQMEHENSPAYLEQCTMQKRPKGTLFLTVSLHRNPGPDSSGKQEYRIDIPLEKEEEVPTRIFVRKPRRGEEATSPVIHKHGAHESITGTDTQLLASNFRMNKYYMAANQFYVLSPACIAEISMRMTLSQVLDWPRAEVLGQSEVDLFHYMLWKRVTSYVQDFRMKVLWENLPSSGDGSVLVLSLPRAGVDSKKTVLPPATDKPNSPAQKNQKANYLITGGFTTWTVIPFTDQSRNQYGTLVSLGGSSLDSARRRMWFVLVDAVLYIYALNSSKPKYQFPMLSCSCTYVEGQVGMFKLRTPSETFFLVDDDEKSGRLWFRKLYEQAPHHKPFEALEAAMQTPWAVADAALAAQLEEERRSVVLGTTDAGRKNNLLAGLQKATNLTAVDDTKGTTHSKAGKK